MNRKVRKLKRELGAYKAAAIADIVVAVIVWVGIAYLWGMMEGVRGSLPWNAIIGLFVVAILVGVLLLAAGILTIHLVGRVAEALKEAYPEEDDE